MPMTSLPTLINDPDWKSILAEHLNSAVFANLAAFLEKAYKSEVIFPPEKDIFNAFNLTPFNQVKVVILGQDPYHGHGQAHGLAFSVKEPTAPPPSLKNIFKEANINSTSGDLSEWAKQGVLLLNTVLTVQSGQPNSHRAKGWETFTDLVIQSLSEHRKNIIFLLWGTPAQKKIKLIDKEKHFILTAPHPSPLSAYRGFFGCQHFTKVNDILSDQNKSTINWQISSPEPLQPMLF